MAYFNTNDFDMDKSGILDVTSILQDLIDKSDKLYIAKGIYLVSSLFLHSNMTIHLDKGAVLLATTDESKYVDINTRVAGIEMKWYPAVLNAIDCENVTIEGEGMINGSGPYWYNKYWGVDTKGGMREAYDKANVRFLCDYDCKRPRNLYVANSSNVVIDSITSKDSGFWNIHILYSHDVLIKGVNIDSAMNNSPSTDGIDIDSCYNVVIDGVTSSTNDDSFCIKSGRDFDGIRVNRPCHDIEIKHCKVLKGFGITLGSELSGGIYNINIHDIDFNETDCAFRIKSSSMRKGYIKNINVSNLNCVNVKYLFHINLNWNPNYNKCVIPSDYNGEIKDYYSLLLKTKDDLDNTLVDDIYIKNVNANYNNDYNGISRVFHLEGFSNQHIRNICLSNSNIKANEYGYIKYVDNLNIDNSVIETNIEIDNKNNSYDER